MISEDYLEDVCLQRGNVYNKVVNLKLLVYMVKFLKELKKQLCLLPKGSNGGEETSTPGAGN